MILTEEQRAAIKLAMKYIARWPFAYKELHARGVLQAMIDSSEHIREPPKMVGFDLERARGLRDFLQDDCAEVGDVWAEMIAEIERLRADAERLQLIIDSCHEDLNCKSNTIDELDSYLDQCRIVINQKEARIKELEAEIRELEDAHKRSGVKYAKIINELRSSVYANMPGLKKQWDEIPANGKIGPDADAKPHCWQITEERKAALGVILARIEYDQSLPGRFNYTVSRAKDTLRAMLEEAQP